MKFSSDGLVVGGVEVGCVRGLSVETEVVFDPTAWVKDQFAELRLAAQRTGKETVESIAIESHLRFADISATKTKYIARYYHPKYLTIQGFFHIPEKIEYKDIDDAAADVIKRALLVDLHAVK